MERKARKMWSLTAADKIMKWWPTWFRCDMRRPFPCEKWFRNLADYLTVTVQHGRPLSFWPTPTCLNSDISSFCGTIMVTVWVSGRNLYHLLNYFYPFLASTLIIRSYRKMWSDIQKCQRGQMGKDISSPRLILLFSHTVWQHLRVYYHSYTMATGHLHCVCSQLNPRWRLPNKWTCNIKWNRSTVALPCSLTYLTYLEHYI